MIQIVMKPVPGAGVVKGETLYTALFGGEDVGVKVRARRASHAEDKLMEVFRRSVAKRGGGILVDYNLEQWLEEKNGKAQEPAAEEGAADEEAGVRGAEAPQVHRLQDDDDEGHA